MQILVYLEFLRAILRHSPALIKRKLLTNNKQQLPAIIPPNTRTIATNTAESSMIVPTTTITSASQLSSTSNIDRMDDSVIYNKSEMKSAKRSSGSFHTEEEEEEEGYIDNDVHSLYSNDPEEEQQRLAELQAVDKRASYNADKELLNVYMKTYKQEQETTDELVEKAKILFGENYFGASVL
jgi:hypothetical protein